RAVRAGRARPGSPPSPPAPPTRPHPTRGRADRRAAAAPARLLRGPPDRAPLGSPSARSPAAGARGFPAAGGPVGDSRGHPRAGGPRLKRLLREMPDLGRDRASILHGGPKNGFE